MRGDVSWEMCVGEIYVIIVNRSCNRFKSSILYRFVSNLFMIILLLFNLSLFLKSI